MLFFQRLILTIISLMLFVSTTSLCIRDMYQPPVLNVQAIWENDGFTVTWVRPAGRAWEDGIRPGARITEINGYPPVRSDNLATAQSMEVWYNGATSFTSTAPIARLIAEHFPSAMTLAIWFVGMAHIYFMVARSRTWAWMLLLLCGSGGYAFVTSVLTHGNTPSWAFDLLALSLLVFFSSCLIFALGFPINRLGTRVGKRLALASVATSTIIGLLYLSVVYTNVGRYESFRSILQTTYLINGLAAFLLAVRSFIKVRAIPPLAWAIIIAGAGMAIGLLPFCIVVLIPLVIWGAPLLPPYLVSNSLIFFALGLIVAAAQLETAYSEQKGADDLAAAAQYVKQETARGKTFPLVPPDDPHLLPPPPSRKKTSLDNERGKSRKSRSRRGRSGRSRK